MTSESTRFLGHPNETKPTVGAVGAEVLVTYLLYRGCEFRVGRVVDPTRGANFLACNPFVSVGQIGLLWANPFSFAGDGA